MAHEKGALLVLLIAMVQGSHGQCFSNPVGVEDQNIIPDAQMTASTSFNGYPAESGRLNHASAWCSQSLSNEQEWLQVDLGDIFDICGVATRGLNSAQYVTRFQLSYSTDGFSWSFYGDNNGNTVVLDRVQDGTQTEQHTLTTSVLARYIRFHETQFTGWKCLQVEVYGTRSNPGCNADAVGVEDQNIIPDAQMTASTSFNGYPAESGRLNHASAWCSQSLSNEQEWLQVDLGDIFDICRVSTRGLNSWQYVTRFQLSYSTDGFSWSFYGDNNGNTVVFNRVQDGSQIEQHTLTTSVLARYIRFQETDFTGWKCLQVEVYGTRSNPGCNADAVGVEDQNIIPDAQMTASTSFNGYPAESGRLNHASAWCSQSLSNEQEWLQVDLGDIFDICRVSTRGLNSWQYVTRFQLSYSTDGFSWSFYGDNNGNTVVFNRVQDGSQIEQHTLTTSVLARYIRFQETDFTGWKCLQVEVYGTRSVSNCMEGATVTDECGQECRCSGGQLVDCVRVRREFTSMEPADRQRYINTIISASTEAPYKDDYDRLIQIHFDFFRSGIHEVDQFLPWHRWYILEYENLLRRVDCSFTVSYWQWSAVAQTPWRQNEGDLWFTGTGGFGGNGNPCVTTGPFRQGAWSLTPSAGNQCLQRFFNDNPPDEVRVGEALNFNANQFLEFEFDLRRNLHDVVHCDIHGTMCTQHSANAPEFFLHHGYIDKLWDDWQRRSSNHLNAHFPSVTTTLSATDNLHPSSFIDSLSLPENVRVRYQPTDNAQLRAVQQRLRSMTLSELKEIPRRPSSPLSQSVIDLFRIPPDEVDRIRRREQELQMVTTKSLPVVTLREGSIEESLGFTLASINLK